MTCCKKTLLFDIYLVRRTSRLRVVQFLSVKSKAEGNLDTRAKGLGVACDFVSTALPLIHVEPLPRAMTPVLLILALTNDEGSR